MLVSPQAIFRRCIHTTSVLATKKAGRHKTSLRRDKPLTYEEANKPDQIGVRKSWNSFNTTGLEGGIRLAETAHEDLFIRKFVHGTWPRLLVSDVIIKRRANQIIINFVAARMMQPSKYYFLVGYTEELLSYVLKSPIKIELQTCDGPSDLIFKYI